MTEKIINTAPKLPKAQDGKWMGNLFGCSGHWWGIHIAPILRGGVPTGDYAVQNVIVESADKAEIED